MNLRRFFPASAERTPWHVAILSLVPFILPGPLSPLFAYHPWWDPAQFPFIDAARVPVAIGLLILGFMIGILRKFPRWAYLYSLYILVLLPLGVITLLVQKPFNLSYDYAGYIFFFLVILLSYLFIRFHLFPRLFFAKIRQDWTFLSYVFYACTFFLLSTNDSDESPVYNLQVLLPSLIAWLGALAYLRLGDPAKKIGSLLGASLLGLLIWWLPVLKHNSNTPQGLTAVSGILLIYCLLLGGLILAPILINVVSRPRTQTVI